MDKFVSIPEAAGQLGVGRTSTYALIGEGQLVTAKIGSRRLVLQSSIDALIGKLTAAAAAQK